MNYFPAFINIENKSILIIGAGNIALEKLDKLIKFTKNITILAPEAKYNIYKLIKKYNLTFHQKEYERGDIDNFDIVIIATNDIKLQEEIFKESREKKILVNSVDNKKFCDFIFPSFIKKDNLTIAISTNGVSPAFAKKFRLYLEDKIPEDIEKFLKELKYLREYLPKGEERMKKFAKLVDDYFEKNIN